MEGLLSWHKVGQKVVCVHLPGDHCEGEIFPREGEVYTVRKVLSDYDDVFFLLCEIDNSHLPQGDYLMDLDTEEIGFRTDCFRPVRETSINCFLSLLTPSPDTVRKLEEVG